MAIWVVPLSVLSSGLTSLPAPLPSRLVAAQQRNKLKLQYFRSNWNHRDFLFDSSLKSWKNLESAEVYVLQKSQNHVRNERKAPFFHPDSNSPAAQRTPGTWRGSGFRMADGALIYLPQPNPSGSKKEIVWQSQSSMGKLRNGKLGRESA
ncbi:PREDICTED: uncharacterized protein LOC105577484 isoform X2 [Cercocebus atys]|uniref:uncharacterized protein LOC105577484 isoform X2 n=1 Tax=Cercocebus atys TaxID=9531 RepID=UPI0005F5205A|nr:PREDICTED: uncharacterized protein LOC105577484 isoform X2 [Cercocebus atys]